MRIFVAVAAVASFLMMAPAMAQDVGNSPMNEEEKELLGVEEDVLTLQRKLSAARKKGETEEVKRLQKQFDKAQKKRIGLLRSTWQM